MQEVIIFWGLTEASKRHFPDNPLEIEPSFDSKQFQKICLELLKMKVKIRKENVFPFIRKQNILYNSMQYFLQSRGMSQVRVFGGGCNFPNNSVG